MIKQLYIFIATCLVATGCNPRTSEEHRTVFRYNEAANITTLDPAYARDQAIIWAVNQIFNGLVQLNDRLEVKPCIAKSWMISASGTDYVFHLRNDLRFHDSPAFPHGVGRKVVAGDFVYSFQRILDPAVASPGAWLFNNIRKGGAPFEAPDDTTLIIHLEQPFPPFLRMLTMQYCSVIPHEAVKYFGSNFRRNPVGTGPFRFKLWVEGVKLVLLKNPHYFEIENGARLPHLDAVAVTFIPDKQSAFLEFIKGKLDMLSGIDPTYKDELLTRAGELQYRYRDKVYLMTIPYLNTEYLGFMVGGQKGYSEQKIPVKEVRKAINYAFDREKMIKYLRNNIGYPGCQGITPRGLPSFDSTCKFYNYNPEKAKQLLKDAGFPGGAGLSPITLTSTADYLDICKYIQHQVAAVGIDLRIEVNQPAAVKEMKAEARLPFFRASWIADYPDAENYLAMFYSKNLCPKGPNYTRFSSNAFDKEYEETMLITDDSTRYRYYRHMESIIMDESPIIVLYYDQVLRFVQKNISGLGNNPMNLLTLKRVIKKG